jgi:hypothetical protein
MIGHPTENPCVGDSILPLANDEYDKLIVRQTLYFVGILPDNEVSLLDSSSV